MSASARDRLQAELVLAMKRRDKAAASALRTALSAIANAEAVPAAPLADDASPIAGARSGVGAAEVDRRALSETEIAEIVRREVAEMLATAQAYAERGEDDAARDLRRRAAVIEGCLEQTR